jgi:glycosyltransferase involved in cell wall biosynthesis
MTNIILFDQDTQNYRQSIYQYFKSELLKHGYNLIVVYDKKLNQLPDGSGLFIGIDYSLKSFQKIVFKHRAKIVISFVWLRYKFILPFLLLCRTRGVKTIVWSHGINLQKKQQLFKNMFYYVRQYLADSLIIYSNDQTAFIIAHHRKLFIANNTLHFNSLPSIHKSKLDLKKKYNLHNQIVLLSVGRFDQNNRKIQHLIQVSDLLSDKYIIIIIGSGLTESQSKQIDSKINMRYIGKIYDELTVCEYYKLSDLFLMPGAIGLSLNQAFYYGSPVVIENVDHGPEVYYLKEGRNGLKYRSSDYIDLKDKIYEIINNDYDNYSKCATETILSEGNIQKMLNGFKGALKYVDSKNNSL